MAKLEGHKGKVAEINKALRDQLGLKKNETIPVTYSLLIQKTATDMCVLDKVAEELSGLDSLTSMEVGSMAQQKTVVNPLIPYYDKLSARVTDDLYNLGLTARKQAAKVEEQNDRKDNPMDKLAEALK